MEYITSTHPPMYVTLVIALVFETQLFGHDATDTCYWGRMENVPERA